MSGVAFAVTELSARQPYAGGELAFCCQGCAIYFAGHRARVLAARGLTPDPASPPTPVTP